MTGEILTHAEPGLLDRKADWLKRLEGQRGVSPNTVEAYERDVRQLLVFLTRHHGRPARMADLADLPQADIRGFLASRKTDGAGARTLARGLAGVRSFIRFLERDGQASSASVRTARTPRLPRRLPRPLSPADAVTVTDEAGNTATDSFTVTVNAVAETPTVSGATSTTEDTLSSAIAITRSGTDGSEITHFRISAITGGTLYKDSGASVAIAGGDVITAAEAASVYFRPGSNANTADGGTFGFQVQGARDSAGNGLSPTPATVTLTVATAAVLSNMQTDAAAADGWALVLLSLDPTLLDMRPDWF